MMKKITKYVAMGMCLALACSCNNNSGWSVKGHIEGAQDSTILIEAATFNNWRTLDTIHLDKDGDFKYTAQDPAAVPTVYRLAYKGKYIYFPIDSIETVTVTGNAARFDRGYRLAGNAAAPAIARVDSLVAAAVETGGIQGALTNPQLKTELNLMVNQDSTCIVSYYIVGKIIGDQPLYNPKDKADVRIIANAANNFQRLRPGDARTEELQARWLAARKMIGNAPQKVVQVEANQIGRPAADLARYDSNGNMHNFDQIVGKGKVVVLNFTRYDGENSQANTVGLRKVYDTYGNDVVIYQIAYDPDEVSWKRSARNMPWIAVWNAPTDNMEAAMAYNVNPVKGDPVSFIFNKSGEITQRVTDPEKLLSAVAQAM